MVGVPHQGYGVPYQHFLAYGGTFTGLKTTSSFFSTEELVRYLRGKCQWEEILQLTDTDRRIKHQLLLGYARDVCVWRRIHLSCWSA
eukprot:scaffold92094_cov55-Attheya_sp.AAC.7